MKVTYYPDTDTLYIDLREVPGDGTIEAIEDVVIDVTAEGKPVGIEIEHAREKADLSDVQIKGIARRSTKKQTSAKAYRVGPSGDAYVMIRSRDEVAERTEPETEEEEAKAPEPERVDPETRKRLVSVG